MRTRGTRYDACDSQHVLRAGGPLKPGFGLSGESLCTKPLDPLLDDAEGLPILTFPQTEFVTSNLAFHNPSLQSSPKP